MGLTHEARIMLRHMIDEKTRERVNTDTQYGPEIADREGTSAPGDWMPQGRIGWKLSGMKRGVTLDIIERQQQLEG